MAGSYVAWAVGGYAGQATLRRWGRYVWLRNEDVDRATRWFDRYRPAAVFFGRMPPVVRTFISLPAGVMGVGALTGAALFVRRRSREKTEPVRTNGHA